MARIVVDYDTTATPDQVRAALTDFSERRPDIWPGLSRTFYEVESVGETSALVREGSDKPVKVWARETYDWSAPDTVRWTVRESNFCTPGSRVTVTTSRGPGGGAHVHLVWERTPSNFRGRAALVMMKLVGKKILSSYGKTSLDAYASRAAA